MASAASAIIVPASAPMMWTPSTRSVVLSASTFTKPSVARIRAAARIGGEGILADLVGNARGLQLFLGLADPGHLGLGVDDRRHEIPVHVALLAGERLDAGDAVLARLVRQHRPVDHVADGVDAGHGGLEMRVDGDAAALGRA